MTQHIEWMDAENTTAQVAYPGSPDHPARQSEDDHTAATHYALTLSADEAVVIEGTAAQLAALLDAAQAQLVAAQFQQRVTAHDQDAHPSSDDQ